MVNDVSFMIILVFTGSCPTAHVCSHWALHQMTDTSIVTKVGRTFLERNLLLMKRGIIESHFPTPFGTSFQSLNCQLSSHGSLLGTQIAWSSRAVENPNQLKGRPQNGSLKEAARISWTLASWDMIKLIYRLTESGMIQCHAVGCECGRPCVSCLRRHAAALRQLPTPCVSFRRMDSRIVFFVTDHGTSFGQLE